MNVFGASLFVFAAAAASGAEFKLDPHAFSVPEGFTIENVAATPLVDRPIEADFDEKGRLYVTDSSGTNDKAEKQLEDKPHRIMRLEDTDGDGRYDKSIVYADRMMFPEGAMWHAGSLYVAAPPSIWKLTDTDNDGVADKREEWFKGKTLTGCANDLHGPYLGPDGWIYWTKGAFAKQTYELEGGKPFVTRAAHIFRARPDGTAIEPVMTGGMDNPVGLAFSSGGERFFTTTFFQNPSGGRRDGLVHAIYGGVYGKPHDVLDDHKRTGDLMPVMTHMGPAAPCGLIRYQSDAFGSEYRDNLFACQFNLHKVSRHILRPKGATFTTADSDFLVSDNPDFHPTDVLEDADGSLIVIDTGGWYKMCCPTSQLPKPDVLGGIYRIRRKDAPRSKAARQENPVWALARTNKAAVRMSLTNRDDGIKIAALHSVSARRDNEAIPGALACLRESNNPHVKRAAAEALGRLSATVAIEALLDEAARQSDRVLEHSLIYALIEIGQAEPLRKGLASYNPALVRAALVALDQVDNSDLTAAEVLPLLSSRSGKLRETAEWIFARHKEWAETYAGQAMQQLERKELDDRTRQQLDRLLPQFATNPSMQKALGTFVHQKDAPKPSQLIALRAMAKAPLKEMPESWLAACGTLIAGSDVELSRQGIAVVRAVPPPKAKAESAAAALRGIAENPALAPEHRLEALAAMPSGGELGNLAELAMAHITGPSRNLAVAALSRARLNETQLLELSGRLPKVGPLDLPKLLPSFAAASTDNLGMKLITSLKDAPAFAALPVDLVRATFTNYSAAVKQQAEALLADTRNKQPGQLSRLEELHTSLPNGDIRRGQALFNSSRTACATCHAIGYLGGTLGPDLTRIGQVRTEHDLLESIVFPNASFVRSYEPMIVVTKSGESFNGVLKKDSPEEVVLAMGVDAEAHIPRSDVAEMRAGTISVMPEGLDQQLTRQELADLLAFLKATRW